MDVAADDLSSSTEHPQYQHSLIMSVIMVLNSEQNRVVAKHHDVKVKLTSDLWDLNAIMSSCLILLRHLCGKCISMFDSSFNSSLSPRRLYLV